MVCKSLVACFALFVEDEVDKVKSRQEGRWDVDVVDDREAWIVLTLLRVRSCKNGGSSIQRANNSSLSDRHCLLLHCLMKNHSCVVIHLVKFINAANTPIR